MMLLQEFSEHLRNFRNFKLDSLKIGYHDLYYLAMTHLCDLFSFEPCCKFLELLNFATVFVAKFSNSHFLQQILLQNLARPNFCNSIKFLLEILTMCKFLTA